MKRKSHLQRELRLVVDAIGWFRLLFWLPLIIGKRFVRGILKNIYKQERQSLHNGSQFELEDKERLRVMFVASDNSAASGAFRSMTTLATLLRGRHGIDAFVVLPYSGNGTELLKENSIPHAFVNSADWTIPKDSNPKEWKRSHEIVSRAVGNHFAISILRDLIRRNHVDIVHVNTTWTYVGALAALSEGVPFVWHLREFLEEDQGRTIWSRYEGNTLIAASNAAIAISESMVNKYAPFVPAKRLVKIWNGIDETRCVVRERQCFDRMPYIFVLLGNFRRHKGHLEFSQACAMLYRRGVRNFKVWFVGEGDTGVKEECLSILSAAGMSELEVTCWGFQKSPEKILAQADVAFMCSRAEAFGRVTVEAMMSGCLVVGADTAATKELIKNGKTGILYHYSNGDVNALVEKMQLVISSPRQMREIASNGLNYALKNFTATRNAIEIAALYNSL